jgi:hypothetical protein
MSDPTPDLREALAEYAHQAWSGWMKYLFGKGEYGWADGPVEANRRAERVWMMPQWAVERWQRQMNTPYADLPESEKESDRKEADEMLAIVNQALAAKDARIAALEAQLRETWQPVPKSLEYDLVTHAIKTGEMPSGYTVCRKGE